MKGIDSSKQLFTSNIQMNREENKISSPSVSNYENQGGLNIPNSKNPSYYSRGPVAPGVPLSPASQKDGGQALIGQSSRNMSMLNMKKSSARFLNPLGNDPNSYGGIPVGAPK